jgi:hypothetical protein
MVWRKFRPLVFLWLVLVVGYLVITGILQIRHR